MPDEIDQLVEDIVMADIERCVEEATKQVIDEELSTASKRAALKHQAWMEDFLSDHGYTQVGFWYSKYEPWFPMPEEGEPHEHKDVIVEYLKNGNVLMGYMGYSSCRLCDLHTNGTKDLTDGKYIWPQGLYHYVEEHNTPLPEEFIKHILDNTGTTV